MKERSVRKKIRLIILLGTAGICLLLGVRVQKAISNHVYILSFLQEDRKFHNNDILTAEKEGISLTYMKYLHPEISNGFRTETAAVIATNDNYFYFTGMEITNGAFFNSIQADKKLSVAVLNETAAYQIFGNYDCIGEVVYLEQNAFEVAGIVKEQDKEDAATIYIPDETAEYLGLSGSEINQLWCRFWNIAEASRMISKLGYSMEEINLLQMDLYKGVFMQRFFMLLILTGIALFLRIFKGVFCKEKILSGEVIINKKREIKWILQGAACVGGLICIIKIILLSWYAPPNYVVAGKDGMNVFYEILEFYALAGIEIDNMQFLNRWNLLSMLFFIIYLFVFLLSGKRGLERL